MLRRGIQESAETVARDYEQLSFLIHDMRSVTTSVALMVDLLELAAKAEDDSVQRARAVSAQKSCEQLSLLCSEAATWLTGVEDDALSPQKFDLLELLVEVSAVYSPIYDLAGKNLQMSVTGRPPQFFGNRPQIFRAISNLLENGLKHTSSGASVVIECSDDSDAFAVSISDDGPGIAELKPGEQRPVETLPLVVKHLTNLSPVFTPGTGLKFVSDTITAHGGTSIVEQNDRGGCKFVLAFQKRKLG